MLGVRWHEMDGWGGVLVVVMMVFWALVVILVTARLIGPSRRR